jgi:hypothetical protein
VHSSQYSYTQKKNIRDQWFAKEFSKVFSASAEPEFGMIAFSQESKTVAIVKRKNIFFMIGSF